MGKDYTDYNSSGFLHDEVFLAWMRGDDQAVTAFWEAWLREHPEKTETIHSAQENYCLLTGFQRIHPQPGDQEAVWNGIDSAVRQSSYGAPRLWSSFRKRWWQYAALAVLLVGGVWMGYNKWHQPDYDRIVKAGETIKRVVLPDSTIVVLNKHAELSYSSMNSRAMKLQGEAFFHVRKKWTAAGPQPFTVEAGHVKIAVLGTSFSVRGVGDSSRVLLLEGKVKVTAGARAITMHPGEKLEWSHQHFSEKQVNVQLYMGWKDGEFHFDHTSIQELADLIRDLYGDELVIRDKAALPVNYISGRVSSENQQTLWNALSLLLDVKVEQRGKQVLLIPR